NREAVGVVVTHEHRHKSARACRPHQHIQIRSKTRVGLNVVAQERGSAHKLNQACDVRGFVSTAWLVELLIAVFADDDPFRRFFIQLCYDQTLYIQKVAELASEDGKYLVKMTAPVNFLHDAAYERLAPRRLSSLFEQPAMAYGNLHLCRHGFYQGDLARVPPPSPVSLIYEKCSPKCVINKHRRDDLGETGAITLPGTYGRCNARMSHDKAADIVQDQGTAGFD